MQVLVNLTENTPSKYTWSVNVGQCGTMWDNSFKLDMLLTTCWYNLVYVCQAPALCTLTWKLKPGLTGSAVRGQSGDSGLSGLSDSRRDQHDGEAGPGQGRGHPSHWVMQLMTESLVTERWRSGDGAEVKICLRWVIPGQPPQGGGGSQHCARVSVNRAGVRAVQ